MKKTGGWPELFKGEKLTKNRVQGILTTAGATAFERRRKELAEQTGLDRVSDAHVIEWLARGKPNMLIKRVK